ncbi:MAG: 3-phosphoshikimate 1-carboxyvinyltransferase [Alphaproteobacteria bacterium GM202ARS2]|nr:3-phosphoshikimate 1-carboxyvinyltransferase [Alphaproteobacteria bacterium GM202ARS2]
MSLTLHCRYRKPIGGRLRVPSDKSIAHRALILSALAQGESRLYDLLESDDVLATEQALRDGFGVAIHKEPASNVRIVQGMGGYWQQPNHGLDMGNSGTAARLLIGAVASQTIRARFDGDSSLRGRPMQRITEPLTSCGAQFQWHKKPHYLPLTVQGTMPPMPCQWTSPVASAQVKSALLLAGLKAHGMTSITEPALSRDHTERMLQHFGVDVTTQLHDDNSATITMAGRQVLQARTVRIPADPSSGAFPTAAALMTNGSLTLTGVCLNPLRLGFYSALTAMGAKVAYSKTTTQDNEPIGDITIDPPPRLSPIDWPAHHAPMMIDDYPALAVLAAHVDGTTRLRGLAELRVKESDRLTALCDNLNRCGTQAHIDKDDLIIIGKAPQHQIEQPATIDAQGDHRIAMAFLVYGMARRTQPIIVRGAETITTSFPDFVATMNTHGAGIDST